MAAAAKRSVVVFDLGGVLFGGLSRVFQRYEESHGLPANFIQDVLRQKDLDGPFPKAMIGQIGMTQLFSEFEEDCKQAATARGLSLSENVSLNQIVEDEAVGATFNSAFLQAAVKLKNHGFKIAVLTNNWINDSPHRHRMAMALCFIRRHFDAVIESCRIGLKKPDPKIFEYALSVLKAAPHEVIFLDDVGEYLKPAKQMGIATILVKDTNSALKELQNLTGVQLLDQEETLPPACDPENVTHGYVNIKPGTRLHFVEMGEGPVVCLCHGFPESWLSWRFQIPALAAAGFRVIALEMKGYGESTAPPAIGEYSQEEICKDLVVFLDKMAISQAAFIGHDWGGSTVWCMALFYPERVRAVASLNTPYTPAIPGVDIMELIKSIPIFDYQLYFQDPGVAEAELEKNLRRTLSTTIRSTRVEDKLEGSLLNVSDVRKRGGFLVGLPEDPPLSSLLPEPVLQFYIQQFQKSGFRGPLNWYRNLRENWSWNLSAQGRKILIPALMVTVGKDRVLHPNMSKHMEKWIPQLSRGHIEDCGHFTQLERPAAANKILIDWLEKVHQNAVLQTVAKL